MHIRDDRYSVEYNPETATITCQGSLRLYGGTAYASIIDLLNTIADQQPARVVLDIRGLHFVNSSGINVFYKFILQIRDYKSTRLEVRGAETIFWQPKLMLNFQRLLPEIEVTWDEQRKPEFMIA